MFKKSKRGIKKKTMVIPINVEELREMVREILIDMDRIKEENKNV